MKIRNMLGLAAIGGVLYLHRKNGGEFTVESFKCSLKDLLDAVEKKSKDLGAKAQDKLREAKDRVDDIAVKATTTSPTGMGYNGPARR